jgi:EAL domain-containing protein (putative c-di-GMP-specific phosphodiesterase class I)
MIVCLPPKGAIALLLREAKNKGDLAELKETFDLLNMDIIAERIEDDDSLLQLLDQPVHLGQGYLLDKPRIRRESA